MYSSPNLDQLSDDAPTRCRQIITMFRLIVFALFMGLLVITGVFTVLVYGFIGPPLRGGIPLFGPGLPGLSLVGSAILLTVLVAVHFVSRGMIASFQRRLGSTEAPPLDRFAPDPNDLEWTQQIPKSQLFHALELYPTYLLTRVALIEGAGVMNAVFFFLEGEEVALVAVSCVLALLAAHFPSPASLSNWLRKVLGSETGVSV
jgi:hypothetical protein